MCVNSNGRIHRRSTAPAVVCALAVIVLINPKSALGASPVAADARVLSTVPHNGYVYPGQDLDGIPVGLEEFTVTFSSPLDLEVGTIAVQTTGRGGPNIIKTEATSEDATHWRVHLDRPISPRGETTFLFFGGDVVTLSALPGDVNQDGVLSIDDVLEFLDAFHMSDTDPLWHDMDGNGIVETADYERLVELHEGVNSMLPGNTADPYAITRMRCCEAFGVCVAYLVEECPNGTVEVSCPCGPRPEYK